MLLLSWKTAPLFLFLLLYGVCLGPTCGYTGKSNSPEKQSELLRLEKYIESLEAYTRDHPKRSSGWIKLGEAYQSRDITFHDGGNHQPKALHAYEKALSLPLGHKDRLDVIFKKGLLYYIMGRALDAVESFESIVVDTAANMDDKIKSLYHKGISLQMLGSIELAISTMRSVLDLKYDYLAAYKPLVECHRELIKAGKKMPPELWQNMYDEVFAILSNKQPEIFNEEKFSRQLQDYEIETLKKDLTIPSDSLYAMQKICSFLGRLDIGWWFLRAGRGMEKLRRSAFDVGKVGPQTQAIIQVFRGNFWPKGIGHPSSVPVFIIGFMRSGSTLLEHILDAHSQIMGIGEDSIFNSKLPVVRDEIVAAIPKGHATLNEVVNRNAELIVEKMHEKADVLQEANNVVLNVTEGKPNSKGNVSHIVDKMLFNFPNVGLIHLIYPNAVILNLVRDPLDTILSCLMNKFDDRGLEWTLDEDHIIAEYISYLEIMQHWRSVLPGRVIDVQYEDIVYNLEPMMKKLIDKFGIEWEEKILKFHRSRRAILTNSMTQVRHKVTDSAISKWKLYKDQLRSIITRLKPILHRLNLPFRDTVNWGLSEKWEYCDYLNCTTFRKQDMEEKIRPKWLPDTVFDGIGARLEL